MTINCPAAVIFAMYVAVAERAGVERRRLGGTLQNDILKEFHAQKEFVFPPRPSMRLVRDTITFCAAEMPRWHPISMSGYHIREAGSTAAEELAFTLADGFAYVEAGPARPASTSTPSRPGCRSSSTPTSTSSRRSPSTAPPAASGPAGCASATAPRTRGRCSCGSTPRPPGVSLTAQQPEVNIARTAIEALAGVLGGTQSLHTNSMDEALALPTEKAARIALRTQQVIAHETGVANVADPLGGSWFVEALTDEMERQAEEIFAHLDDLGGGSMLEGVHAGIEDGLLPGPHRRFVATTSRSAVNRGERIVVGVNRFTEGNEDDDIDILLITAEQEQAQIKRLAAVKADRDSDAVAGALDEVRTVAADPEVNLMPALLDAVRAYATEGEIMRAMGDVFGYYIETPVL